MDVLKKKFEDEERKKKAMDTFNTPKSKILGGLERKRPARDLVSPLGARHSSKTQHSNPLTNMRLIATRRRSPRTKAKTSFMPILRSRKDLLGAPPDKNIPSPKMD